MLVKNLEVLTVIVFEFQKFDYKVLEYSLNNQGYIEYISLQHLFQCIPFQLWHIVPTNNIDYLCNLEVVK